MRSDSAPPGSTPILVEDPELCELLEGERLVKAQRSCVARVVVVPSGPWQPSADGTLHAGIGLLVLRGTLLRRVGLAGRFGAELLGEGDLLRPAEHEGSSLAFPRTGAWQVLGTSRIAVLDKEFTTAVCPFPEVVASLFGRAIKRTRRIAVNMAIVQKPRVDLRLQMLFWELADRWGTVHQDGIHVPMALTHSILAELVAARRPTVTKALGELARSSDVVWTGQHWLLPGNPPREFSEVPTR